MFAMLWGPMKALLMGCMQYPPDPQAGWPRRLVFFYLQCDNTLGTVREGAYRCCLALGIAGAGRHGQSTASAVACLIVEI